jgi:hypothetical protein
MNNQVCDYRAYTLTFSSMPVGTRVHAFKTDIQRATEVNVRHNFWGNKIILDGSYPAIIWNHTFIVYTERPNVKDFVNAFFAMSNFFTGVPRTLTVVSSFGTEIDFGSCYMSNPVELSSPDHLLQHKAGFIQLGFVGSVRPNLTFTTTP